MPAICYSVLHKLEELRLWKWNTVLHDLINLLLNPSMMKEYQFKREVYRYLHTLES